jgi:hypothetical protein
MTVDIKFNCPCAARAHFDHRWRHHELNKYLFRAKIQNAFGRGFHLPMKVRLLPTLTGSAEVGHVDFEELGTPENGVVHASLSKLAHD